MFGGVWMVFLNVQILTFHNDPVPVVNILGHNHHSIWQTKVRFSPIQYLIRISPLGSKNKETIQNMNISFKKMNGSNNSVTNQFIHIVWLPIFAFNRIEGGLKLSMDRSLKKIFLINDYINFQSVTQEFKELNNTAVIKLLLGFI